jgi:SSS family solute:Na+ symporter
VAISAAFYFFGHSLPFMDRVGIVFLMCLAIAIIVSLLQRRPDAAMRVELKQIDYSTSTGFNVAAVAVTVILAALYITWW